MGIIKYFEGEKCSLSYKIKIKNLKRIKKIYHALVGDLGSSNQHDLAVCNLRSERERGGGGGEKSQIQ